MDQNTLIEGSPFVRYHCSVLDKDKESGALLIAASIIAAIRLRGEPVQPSPKLTAVLKDSISLAQLLMAELRK